MSDSTLIQDAEFSQRQQVIKRDAVIKRVLSVDNHSKRWSNAEVERILDEAVRLEAHLNTARYQQIRILNRHITLIDDLTFILKHNCFGSRVVRYILKWFFPMTLARIERQIIAPVT